MFVVYFTQTVINPITVGNNRYLNKHELTAIQGALRQVGI